MGNIVYIIIAISVAWLLYKVAVSVTREDGCGSCCSHIRKDKENSDCSACSQFTLEPRDDGQDEDQDSTSE